MGGQEGVDRGGPAVAFGLGAGDGAAEAFGAGEERLDGCREGGAVVGGGQAGGADDAGKGGEVTDDDWGAAGQGFDGGEAEGLGGAGGEDDIGGGLEGGERGPVGDVPEESDRQPGGAGDTANNPAAVRTASASPGGTSRPVTPWSARSTGPPVAGAITGRPLAMASWMVWQNVSNGPVCAKTSSEAKIRASSFPVRRPRKTAPGRGGGLFHR